MDTHLNWKVYKRSQSYSRKLKIAFGLIITSKPMLLDPNGPYISLVQTNKEMSVYRIHSIASSSNFHKLSSFHM